jgi:hypothetical protein
MEILLKLIDYIQNKTLGLALLLSILLYFIFHWLFKNIDLQDNQALANFLIYHGIPIVLGICIGAIFIAVVSFRKTKLCLIKDNGILYDRDNNPNCSVCKDTLLIWCNQSKQWGLKCLKCKIFIAKEFIVTKKLDAWLKKNHKI